VTRADKSRHLSAKQTRAVESIIRGATDAETARTAGVARQTVNEWRNWNPTFQAELNRRRKEQWHAATERLRSLAGRAVEVLDDDLRGDDPKARREAALHVLRAVKLYGADLEPDGPTTAEELMTQRMLIAAGKMLVQVLAACDRNRQSAHSGNEGVSVVPRQIAGDQDTNGASLPCALTRSPLP